MTLRRAVLAICAFLLLVPASHAAADSRGLRPEVDAFIEEMARKHQFDGETLRRWFGRVTVRQSILRAVYAPATALTWAEFRARILTEARVVNGARFWREHAQTLERAAREFGVPEEIIVATIGIETLYGRQKGGFGVLEALSTLAFDYPERAAFFRSELEAFLLLVREYKLSALGLKGSYAGAMGIPQFMPSSYRKYAVDFDGDGKADIWNSNADAIGSVANYYRAFGWRTGEPVVIAADPGMAEVDAVIDAGIKPFMKVGELRRRGVVPLAAVGDDAETALFVVETDYGSQHYLGLDNFYVITRYNRSVNYALAVYELAREVRKTVGRSDN